MPRPPIEEPVTVKKSFSPNDDNTVTTHPSFGQISIHRVNGNAVLYGSDFVHHNTVRIAIHRSQLNRNLSHDWYFANETVVEVEMSEAQWATYVSSFNVGTGVPCTLRFVQNDEVPTKPGLPDPDIRGEFSSEVGKTIKDAMNSLKRLKEKVLSETTKLPKKTQAELIGPIEAAMREIGSNISFVQESFDKHVEDSIEKAKVEIHAHVNNVLVHTGLEHMQNRVFLLEKKDGEGEV